MRKNFRSIRKSEHIYNQWEILTYLYQKYAEIKQIKADKN